MPQSLSKKYVKDNATVIGGHVLVQLKGIILMPIIIKTVGVTVYGGFVLLSSLFGIIFGISSFGAGFRAKRFLPSTKDVQERRKLFYPQFLFQIVSILIISLILILLDRQIKLYLFKNEISYSIVIIPFYLLCYSLYFQGSDYFRYTSRVSYMTLANVCFPYIYIVILLLYYLIFRYININVLVLSQALSALLIVIPTFYMIFREIGTKLSFYGLNQLISDVKLGFPLVLGFIVDFVLAAVDRYFIAFYLSVSAVGYYQPGYVLGSLIIFIPKAMYIVISVLMSKAVDDGNLQEAQQILNYSFKTFFLLAIPFAVGSVILGKPILFIIANSQIAENAWPVVPLVALGSLFCGLNFFCSSILFVQQKTSEMFKVNLAASLFNLVANSILLYFFRNIIVAAITTLLSYIIGFVYVYRIALREWKVNFCPMIIVKSAMASLLMVVILISVSCTSHKMVPALAMLVVELFIGVLAYVAGLFLLQTFSKKELLFMKSLLSR